MSRRCCTQEPAVQGVFDPRGQAKGTAIQHMPRAANAGLVWNRYLDVWRDSAPPRRDGAPPRRDGASSRLDEISPVRKEGTERHEALSAFSADFNARTTPVPSAAARGESAADGQTRGEPSSSLTDRLLAAVHARQTHVLAQLRGGGHGQVLQCALTSRFATGLGSPHPTEIGFLFDRSVGVPFLPGSSIKGLARAAAQIRSEPLIEVLFGPDRIIHDRDANIGDLIFLDAYPEKWPQLEIDVITCHHSNYYTGNSHDSYPSETESPIPVYFLTVVAGTPWTFRLLSRSGEHAARGVELLRFGLAELGAGAKTAVGYGSFAT